MNKNSVPYIIIDDFLENPNLIKNWALSLDYNPAPLANFPGKRTECLSNINYHFFNSINRKIINVLGNNSDEVYFNKNNGYKTSLFFQLIENYKQKGFIHQDPNVYTYIIYLNDDNDLNSGTSLYKLKSSKPFPVMSDEEFNLNSLFTSHHSTKDIPSHSLKEKEKYYNNTFQKILDIPSFYNRLIIFPGNQYHAANNLETTSNSRLTLIGFVHEVPSTCLPLLRSNLTTYM